LDELIAQLLEKDPEKRIPTARALYHKLETMEQVLRNQSEAKTSANPVARKTDDTELYRSPTNTSLDNESAGKRTRIKPQTDDFSAKVESPPITRESTQHRYGDNQDCLDDDRDAERQINYYNPVTDDQRQRQLREHESSKRSTVASILVLAAALTAALVLVAFGIYQAVRLPTADELLADIRSSAVEPQKKIAEIRDFLIRFPDHENVAEVESLERNANAAQLLKRLRTRSNLNGVLTPVEQQFLEAGGWIDKKRNAQAYNALQVFVTLFEGEDVSDQRDQDCLDAAKILISNLKPDAEREMERDRQTVANLLKKAQSSPVEKSLPIYRHIIENFDFAWTSSAVREARSRLDQHQ
jgi:hypothetical protein